MFQIGVLTRTSDSEVMCTGHLSFVSKYLAVCLLTKPYKHQLCLILFSDHPSKYGAMFSPSISGSILLFSLVLF